MGADEFIKRAAERGKELRDSSTAERLKYNFFRGAKVVKNKVENVAGEGVRQAKSQAKEASQGVADKIIAAKKDRDEKNHAEDIRARVEDMRKNALREKSPTLKLGAGGAIFNPVAGSVLAASSILRNMYLKRDEENQKRLRAEAGIPEDEWQRYVARLRAEKRVREVAAKKEANENRKEELARRKADRPRLIAEKEERHRLEAERKQHEREPEAREIKKAWELIQQELQEGPPEL